MKPTQPFNILKIIIFANEFIETRTRKHLLMIVSLDGDDDNFMY